VSFAAAKLRCHIEDGIAGVVAGQTAQHLGGSGNKAVGEVGVFEEPFWNPVFFVSLLSLI